MRTAQIIPSARKADIAAAFGAAAGRYEANAAIQRTVAGHLADMAAREQLGPGPRILEIGCGTGFLTEAIRMRWPAATLVATDLAPQMLAETGRRGAADTLIAMDGEAPVFEGQWFDLIVSSLAFQWFSDLRGALSRLCMLLRPGGSLYFATMGADSFASWRQAHATCGVSAGTSAYPTLGELQQMLAAHEDAFACDEHHRFPEKGGAALIRHFRGLGAQVPREDYRPLDPAAMRRVIRAYDAAGGETDYHVLYGRITHAS